ncbi:hypothetical protein Q8A73_009899 [Channa argus]|nr:hypothetical protein Q8A73_009899 [Channa argus]
MRTALKGIVKHPTVRAGGQQDNKEEKLEKPRGATFSSTLYCEVFTASLSLRPGTVLRPVCVSALRRNAEQRASALTGGTPPPTTTSSSLRHNKLIPTLLTSHPRQSSELGARQGRARAQGSGCRATARLGRTVTRVLMEGLLGDGDGDVSRRDVPPRDVSLCRDVARGQPGCARDRNRNRKGK